MSDKTWTWEFRADEIEASDGGFLVPDAMLEVVSVYTTQPSAFHSFIREVPWERQLAAAIAQRSIRHRTQRAFQEARRRLSNARAALAGEWEGGYDE